MAYSKAKLKSSGDKSSPCFRPFSKLKLTNSLNFSKLKSHWERENLNLDVT
jgi:hypothetical protein